MSTMRIRNSLRNTQAAAWNDDIDTGPGIAKLQLRTGARPTNLTDAAAGTLLVEYDLTAPGTFGAPSAGTITAVDFPATVAALATGTIGHFRVLDRDGNPVEDSESVGTVAGATELVVNTLDVTEAQDVTIESWTITQPAE